MIDIDWFMGQSEDALKQAEALILSGDYHGNEPNIYVFAAWANWLNVRLMVKTGMVVLTEDQQHQFDYIRNKFVQFSSYLPSETSGYSIG